MRSRFPEFVLVFFFLFTLSFPQDSLNIRYVGVWDPLEDFFSVTNIWNFGVYNGYLYVSGSFADVDSEGDTVVYHLVVVDVHNPEDPYVVSGYQIYPMEFYILNGFLYYFKFSSRALVIIDIRDPRGVDTACVFDELLLNPFGRNIYPFEGDGISYVVVKAYSSEFGRGYYLLDVSDPYSPELLCKFHEFKPDTEWGEDPDWHAIRYGYTAAVDYPYVYVGELKEGWGSEWDPYDDIYRHVPVWDSLFIYRYDVRDLSAEPAVCVRGDVEMNRLWAASGLVFVITEAYSSTTGLLVLSSDDSGMDSVCVTDQLWVLTYVSGDSIYYGMTVYNYAGGCEFDTIGYYPIERLLPDAVGISAIRSWDRYIYCGLYNCGTDWWLDTIMIFEWLPEGISGDEVADEDEGMSLVVYGDVLVFDGRMFSEMDLCDISGRVLSKIYPDKRRIYIGNYPSGIYFLRSVDGRFSKKVVIIH